MKDRTDEDKEAKRKQREKDRQDYLDRINDHAEYQLFLEGRLNWRHFPT